jgi:hypothetical protein
MALPAQAMAIEAGWYGSHDLILWYTSRSESCGQFTVSSAIYQASSAGCGRLAWVVAHDFGDQLAHVQVEVDPLGSGCVEILPEITSNVSEHKSYMIATMNCLLAFLQHLRHRHGAETVELDHRVANTAHFPNRCLSCRATN